MPTRPRASITRHASATVLLLALLAACATPRVEPWAISEGLNEHPNGLLVEGDSLVVAAWGKPEADFSTKVPGHLYRLNLASGAKTLITPKPTGNLDGLESDGRGGYITSSATGWRARSSGSRPTATHACSGSSSKAARTSSRA